MATTLKELIEEALNGIESAQMKDKAIDARARGKIVRVVLTKHYKRISTSFDEGMTYADLAGFFKESGFSIHPVSLGRIWRGVVQVKRTDKRRA